MPRCGRSVKLPGGYTYSIVKSRGEYTCLYCGEPIRRGDYYVLEKAFGITRRYHVYCITRVVPRIVPLIHGSRGLLLCLSEK